MIYFQSLVDASGAMHLSVRAPGVLAKLIEALHARHRGLRRERCSALRPFLANTTALTLAAINAPAALHVNVSKLVDDGQKARERPGPPLEFPANPFGQDGSL
jgi:hypothetical protein